MSETREVENYLDFFAIKVASDVIPMDWWKGYRHQFPCTAKLARENGCVSLLRQLRPKDFFQIVG
jgi:hAT family C-terminal dimerisation region